MPTDKVKPEREARDVRDVRSVGFMIRTRMKEK